VTVAGEEKDLDRPMRNPKLDRLTYCQGMTQERRDELDGERDALRVLEGLEPLRRLDSTATEAYRRGWDEVVERMSS
jgi:hypothetical protein